jgi:hypothetical protein
MNKIRCKLAIILLLFNYLEVNAQLSDGVTGTTSYIKEIIKNYSKEDSIDFDLISFGTLDKIPVGVHIVKNIKGSAGVNTVDIYNSLSAANVYFKNIGIRFYIDSLDYINDYNYSYVTYNYNRIELLTKYATANKINLYLVDSIKMGTTLSYGFTYFPNVTDSNFIFLNKSYLSSASLSTMLGHFMGLLSTHESNGGAELVSESNCAASGDFICDTYADPDLFSLVVDTCKYTGTAKDANGKFYVPSVANIMSNSLDNCKCVFTTLQYRRMYYYYKKYRQYLH